MSLGIKYYACLGIIDHFELSMTKEEVMKKLARERREFDIESGEMVDLYEGTEKLNEIEKLVSQTIYLIEKEYPHTIRYFCIPEFDMGGFGLCIIAKISNNGSTYVFTSNEKILDALNENVVSKKYKL